MDNRPCEVVGCCRPASWIRFGDALPNLEEALCSPCWDNLHLMKPQSAIFYMPYDAGDTAYTHIAVILPAETGCDDVIYIR